MGTIVPHFSGSDSTQFEYTTTEVRFNKFGNDAFVVHNMLIFEILEFTNFKL